MLERRKANYASRNDEIRLRWRNGVIGRAGRGRRGRSPFGTLGVDVVFVDLVREFEQQGRVISASPQALNFAPRIFEKLPSGARDTVTARTTFGVRWNACSRPARSKISLTAARAMNAERSPQGPARLLLLRVPARTSECGGLRRFRKNSNRRTVNPLTDMAERRFVRRSAAVLGNPQKIRLRRSAAVVRYSPPMPPYAPLARFRSARGAAPEGRPLGWPASSLAPSLLRLALLLSPENLGHWQTQSTGGARDLRGDPRRDHGRRHKRHCPPRRH